MRDFSTCLLNAFSQVCIVLVTLVDSACVYFYRNLAVTLLILPLRLFKARETAVMLQRVQRLILVTLRYIRKPLMLTTDLNESRYVICSWVKAYESFIARH